MLLHDPSSLSLLYLKKGITEASEAHSAEAVTWDNNLEV